MLLKERLDFWRILAEDWFSPTDYLGLLLIKFLKFVQNFKENGPVLVS